MKKIVFTTAIVLSTVVIATSGVNLINQKNIKPKSDLNNKKISIGNEIASAD